MMKSKAWIAIYYTVLYSILYFSTLNLNYVEGDDAATVLYHLCGRNTAIQKPYAAYNSGLDYIIQASGLITEQVLGLLPY
jgi:hypothetical protein